ncbi:uncharacterized protein BO97DRAFT_6370 [Aspergillus homomorphus CBS 101889]|uniref:Uncharacterized protein n=1 Tax=Aspergillus homomorphus (strain CBS 101889) TaxID=1450537 RepID=A0A395IE59_ASPHC|nr:hypothetical protein BO97DRAFT_6370 [Aspergillus homomorphus CBS 101889]RAL17438.1 hypothetical protein BO97DRAFT_6370 [Aspergillus homomorphus CBS 101889]
MLHQVLGVNKISNYDPIVMNFGLNKDKVDKGNHPLLHVLVWRPRPGSSSTSTCLRSISAIPNFPHSYWPMFRVPVVSMSREVMRGRFRAQGWVYVVDNMTIDPCRLMEVRGCPFGMGPCGQIAVRNLIGDDILNDWETDQGMTLHSLAWIQCRTPDIKDDG